MQDSEFVSLYGTTQRFKTVPPDQQAGLSLSWGRHSARVMKWLVTSEGPFSRRQDRVKHARVGILRRRFRVVHEPTRRNPLHVSVYYDDGDWDDGIGTLFEQCFGPAVGPEEE